MVQLNSASVKSGDEVFVVFVDKKDAKTAKNRLEENELINKDFRLTPVSSLQEMKQDCIAVPLPSDTIELEVQSALCKYVTILGFGKQYCPYSTSILGNHNQIRCPSSASTDQHTITLVQSGVLKAFSMFLNRNRSLSHDKNQSHLILLEERMRLLDAISCPKTLQNLGDDKTLVIPLKSFDIERDMTFRDFVSFGIGDDLNDSNRTRSEVFVSDYLWAALASAFNSPRVVRRGEIDPDSKIRFSQYQILWPAISQNSTATNTLTGSPGWITVTEQGIRQSFDLTKVMFSRGNITEKIRFGNLVQPGEIVLDLYAGIGYFTLPALIHGGAGHVYCCEWNSEAGKSS